MTEKKWEVDVFYTTQYGMDHVVDVVEADSPDDAYAEVAVETLPLRKIESFDDIRIAEVNE